MKTIIPVQRLQEAAASHQYADVYDTMLGSPPYSSTAKVPFLRWVPSGLPFRIFSTAHMAGPDRRGRKRHRRSGISASSTRLQSRSRPHAAQWFPKKTMLVEYLHSTVVAKLNTRSCHFHPSQGSGCPASTSSRLSVPRLYGCL